MFGIALTPLRAILSLFLLFPFLALWAAPQQKAITYLRGHIKTYQKIESSKKNLKSTLTIRNIKSQEIEKKVFSPDENDGRYFAILAPDNVYAVSVQPEGFATPYEFEVYIPAQAYLYELDKDIEFEPVFLFDSKVKETITVRNSYQNIKNISKENIAQAEQLRYDFMIEFQDYLMGQNNREAFVSAQELIAQGEIQIDLANYVSRSPEESLPDQKYDDLFYALDKAFENQDTSRIASLYQDTDIQQAYLPQSEQALPEYAFSVEIKNPDSLVVLQTYAIYFDEPNSRRLNLSQRSKLEQIVLFMNQNQNVRVEIFGKFDGTGEGESAELRNSFRRTKTVYDYIRRNLSQKQQLQFVTFGFHESLKLQPNQPSNKPQIEVRICAPR
jgi:outer membrane protein OmpA-like peptidoglycan-associated protein